MSLDNYVSCPSWISRSLQSRRKLNRPNWLENDKANKQLKWKSYKEKLRSFSLHGENKQTNKQTNKIRRKTEYGCQNFGLL